MTSISLDTSAYTNALMQTSSLTPEQINQNIENISTLLSSMGIENVSTSNTNGTGSTSLVFSVPDLDVEGEDSVMVEVTCSDLEKIIAQLQAENDEAELERIQQSLKDSKTELKGNYDTTMEKINKSIDEAREQEKQNKVSKIFGIFGAILSIVSAVAVTVLTGGVAAGFAIAGAVVAVASVVMDCTGATEALTEAIEDSIKKTNPDMGKAEREAAAAAATAAIFLAASLICSIGSMAGAGRKVASNASKAIKKTMQVTKLATGAVGLATSVAGGTLGLVQAGQTKKTADAAADVTEMQAQLLKIQKVLEDQNDMMEAILAQLGDVFGAMMEVMNSTTDTSDTILQMGRQMA